MYSDQQSYGCMSTGCGFLTLVLVFAGGWLMYGTSGAAFWLVVLWIVLGLAALVGLVPFVGPFLYWKLATTSVLPSILGAAGLSTSWLTTLALWFGLLASVFWTIVTVAVILSTIAAVLQAAGETT